MDFLVQKHTKNVSKSHEISQSTPPRLPAYAGNPGGVVQGVLKDVDKGFIKKR